MKSLGEEFKERKNELGLTTEQLSRLSGIPTGTINKILNGETKSPRYATLKALNDVLFRDIDSDIDGIREAAVAYTFLPIRNRANTLWTTTMPSQTMFVLNSSTGI